MSTNHQLRNQRANVEEGSGYDRGRNFSACGGLLSDAGCSIPLLGAAREAASPLFSDALACQDEGCAPHKFAGCGSPASIRPS